MYIVLRRCYHKSLCAHKRTREGGQGNALRRLNGWLKQAEHAGCRVVWKDDGNPHLRCDFSLAQIHNGKLTWEGRMFRA